MKDWEWMRWLTGFLVTLGGLIAGYFLARWQQRWEQIGRDNTTVFDAGFRHALGKAEDVLWSYSMRLREGQSYTLRSQDWMLGFEFACATLSSYVEKQTAKEDDDTPALEDDQVP